jgi:hypothetical protein
MSNTEYFKLIRNDNEHVGRAYFDAYTDCMIQKDSFDKISLIKFIKATNDCGVINETAKNILLEFIKPM